MFEVGSVPENPISLGVGWDDDDILCDRRQGFILTPHKLGFRLLSRRVCGEDAGSETAPGQGAYTVSSINHEHPTVCLLPGTGLWLHNSHWCGDPQVKPQ